MVDAQSQHKLFPPGFRHAMPRQALPTSRHYCSEFAHKVFKNYVPSTHHCRAEGFEQRDDQPHWPTFLLSFGLKQICENKAKLYTKEKRQKKEGTKEPDRLLYSVGGSPGADPGQFAYPRALAVSHEGDIGVADTDNHRVQIFNSSGVLKVCMGQLGKHRCEFDRPMGIAAMPNGNFAVADMQNQRVQIMRPKGQVRFIFATRGPPICLACDEQFNLFVGTSQRQIEVFKKGGKFIRVFPLRGATRSTQYSLATNNREELLVCESQLRTVCVYSYEGHLMRHFEPASSLDGLTILPVGISLNPMGDILLADAINHTVNLYQGTTGNLIHSLLGPTDDLGAVQAVAASPEGHLVTTEFSANGEHRLQIFRYLDCTCHRMRKADDQGS